MTTFQASDQLGPGLGREAYGTCARHPEDAGSPSASHWNTAAYIFVLRSVVFGARRTRRNDTLEYKVAGGWACATRHCEQRTAAKLKTSRIDVERDRRFWCIRVPEIERSAQAKHLREVELMAHDLVAIMEDVSPDSFEFDIHIELPEDVRPRVGPVSRTA